MKNKYNVYRMQQDLAARNYFVATRFYSNMNIFKNNFLRFNSARNQQVFETFLISLRKIDNNFVLIICFDIQVMI